jgi:hypothetical protein
MFGLCSAQNSLANIEFRTEQRFKQHRSVLNKHPNRN